MGEMTDIETAFMAGDPERVCNPEQRWQGTSPCTR